MLQYFPTPYSDELWYSVLCRYHIRTGNQNMQPVINRSQFSAGLLFPDSSINQVIERLPEGLFTVRDIIWNHTLFPYFSRMYTRENKESLLSRLCFDTTLNEVPEWRVIARSIPRLKYCPECIREDKHLYGESYWHREHQVPYMNVCRNHKCRLSEYDNRSKREFVGSPILPEFIDSGSAPEYFMHHYEIALAEMLYEYLTQPLEVGPTEGYSNLYYALECKYKTSIDKRTVSLDTKAIYRDLWDYYGERITRAFYGKTMPKYFPMKLRNWEFTSPERYALLAVLIGQDVATTFGNSQKHSFDKKPIRLKELRFPMIRKRVVNG